MALNYQLPPEPPAHVRFERMPQEQRLERSGTPQPPAKPNITYQNRPQQAINEAEIPKTAKKHKPTYGPANIGTITRSKAEMALSHSAEARQREPISQSQKQGSETTKIQQKMRPPTWKDLLKAKQYEQAAMTRKEQREMQVDAQALIAQIRETIELAIEIASFVPETQEDIAEIERRIGERKRIQLEAEYWEDAKNTDPWEDVQFAEFSELADHYRDMVAEKTMQAMKDEAEKVARRKQQADSNGDKIIRSMTIASIKNKTEKLFLLKEETHPGSQFITKA